MRLSPIKIVLACAALLGSVAICGYLLSVSRNGSAIVGCGADGQCTSIIHGRFGSVLGIPVSALAILLDGFLLLAIASRSRSRAVLAGSMVLLGAAIWFVSIQLATRHFCPWCLAVHACNVIAAFLLMFTRQETRGGSAGAFALAIVAIATLATIQLLQPRTTAQTVNLPKDAGGGPTTLPSTRDARTFTEYAGRYTLSTSTLPVLGSPDARRLIVVLFDYCCPHCRILHGMLDNALTTQSAQVAIVALPMPLCSDCNLYVSQTPRGFEHSCEYARLALAVVHCDRGKFPAFDHWMWAQSKTPAVADARRYAETLVGVEPLAKALADPSINSELGTDMELYADNSRLSHSWRLPQMMVGSNLMIGIPADQKALETFIANQPNR